MFLEILIDGKGVIPIDAAVADENGALDYLVHTAASTGTFTHLACQL
jgi:hypothetical protein